MAIQTDEIKAINDRIERESVVVQTITAEVGKAIVGQQYLLHRMLIGLLSNGHILIEGVPGLAKTYAVKTLSSAIRTRYQRIQFTPDLLPSDIVGTMIYNQRTGEFVTSKGPVFANLILADDVRRQQVEGAERTARGDAGTSGHARRPELPARRPVPRARDAEPDRAGGHIPAARGAA